MVNAFPIKNKSFYMNFFKLKSVIMCRIKKYLISCGALVYKAAYRLDTQRKMPAAHPLRRVLKKWRLNDSS
jgi:hypothetical protein